MIIDSVRVRIQGIDTPEKGQPCAEEATAYLRSLLAANGGKATITGTAGTDRYGRTIASVAIGRRDVGRAMLKSGLAVARYDGKDGYASHPRQSGYRALSNPKKNAASTAPNRTPPNRRTSPSRRVSPSGRPLPCLP